MERKQITPEMKARLTEPLPSKALKPHPSKAFLTTINSIYVTERLNDVFGIGAWSVESEIVDNTQKMVVVKTTLTIPEYGIRYECFGGNDNADRGDAHKGAVTDAITKIGSWLGIGAEVWKNEAGKAPAKPAPKAKPAPQATPPQAEEDMDLLTALDEIKRATKVDTLSDIKKQWRNALGDNKTFCDALIAKYNALINK